MQDLSAAVKKAVGEGKSYADAEKEITLPKYESWGGYELFLPATSSATTTSGTAASDQAGPHPAGAHAVPAGR